MKAVVFQAPRQMSVADLPRPEIGPDEVLIASRAVGICHSDFEVLDGHYIIPVSFPVTPGHEWAGEVAEVGREVAALRPGDRVVGECVIAPDHHFGLSSNGAAAEYFKVRPEWLHLLPDELSWSQGALVEPFTVAHYATHAADGVDASDTVVIFGAGPIGQCCVAATVGRGARAFVVDPVPERREVAVQIGAEAGLDPATDDLAGQVRQLTKGRGAEVVFEASGNTAAISSALEVAGREARVVCIGINVVAKAEVPMGLIQSKALRIRGIVGSPNVWPAALRFLARTGVDLTRIVTAAFPLALGSEAFAAARNTDENIKVHIVNH